MVRKWLFTEDVASAGDSKSLVVPAALRFYRRWANEKEHVSARQLIAELHKDDTDLSLENWCSAWGTTRDSLFLSREPLHVAAALGESVQFFGDKDTTDFQACRMLSIRSMWRKRCVILSQSYLPVLRPLPLGVNAD